MLSKRDITNILTHQAPVAICKFLISKRRNLRMREESWINCLLLSFVECSLSTDRLFVSINCTQLRILIDDIGKYFYPFISYDNCFEIMDFTSPLFSFCAVRVDNFLF